MIMTTAQMMGKDIVIYINGKWEENCSSKTVRNILE